MSYETDIMLSLKYQLQSLSGQLRKLEYLNNQLTLSNQLTVLKIKMELGLISKEEASEYIEILITNNETKRKIK